MKKQPIVNIPFDELYLGVVGKIGTSSSHIYTEKEKKGIDTLLKEMESYQTCTELSPSRQKKLLLETKQRLDRFINHFTEEATFLWKTREGELYDLFIGEKISLKDVYIRNEIPLSFYYTPLNCHISFCMKEGKKEFYIKISSAEGYLNYRERNLFPVGENLRSTYEHRETTLEKQNMQYMKKYFY